MCHMASKDPDQGSFHKKMIEIMLIGLDGTLVAVFLSYSLDKEKMQQFGGMGCGFG